MSCTLSKFSKVWNPDRDHDQNTSNVNAKFKTNVTLQTASMKPHCDPFKKYTENLKDTNWEMSQVQTLWKVYKRCHCLGETRRETSEHALGSLSKCAKKMIKKFKHILHGVSVKTPSSHLNHTSTSDKPFATKWVPRPSSRKCLCTWQIVTKYPLLTSHYQLRIHSRAKYLWASHPPEQACTQQSPVWRCPAECPQTLWSRLPHSALPIQVLVTSRPKPPGSTPFGFPSASQTLHDRCKLEYIEIVGEFRFIVFKIGGLFSGADQRYSAEHTRSVGGNCSFFRRSMLLNYSSRFIPAPSGGAPVFSTTRLWCMLG
jgi:hypothetical protein